MITRQFLMRLLTLVASGGITGFFGFFVPIAILVRQDHSQMQLVSALAGIAWALVCGLLLEGLRGVHVRLQPYPRWHRAFVAGMLALLPLLLLSLTFFTIDTDQLDHSVPVWFFYGFLILLAVITLLISSRTAGIWLADYTFEKRKFEIDDRKAKS